MNNFEVMDMALSCGSRLIPAHLQDSIDKETSLLSVWRWTVRYIGLCYSAKYIFWHCCPLSSLPPSSFINTPPVYDFSPALALNP